MCDQEVGYETPFYHTTDDAWARARCIDVFYKEQQLCLRCGVPIRWNEKYHWIEGTNRYSCDRCYYSLQFIESD